LRDDGTLASQDEVFAFLVIVVSVYPPRTAYLSDLGRSTLSQPSVQSENDGHLGVDFDRLSAKQERPKYPMRNCLACGLT
jgi:hypothetical protein